MEALKIQEYIKKCRKLTSYFTKNKEYGVVNIEHAIKEVFENTYEEQLNELFCTLKFSPLRQNQVFNKILLKVNFPEFLLDIHDEDFDAIGCNDEYKNIKQSFYNICSDIYDRAKSNNCKYSSYYNYYSLSNKMSIHIEEIDRKILAIETSMEIQIKTLEAIQESNIINKEILELMKGINKSD